MALSVFCWLISAAVTSAQQAPVTFYRDVAPILYTRCAPCHRPGASAPFSLLSSAEARKRSAQILDAVESRYMPPWLPEPGFGDFAGSRRLTDPERETILRWIRSGAVEGNPQDGPPVPQWPGGWILGPPDLVATMPKVFQLGAEGPDLYRNFVVPVSLITNRYVRAIEFRPGTPKVVHHAFVRVDDTGSSRRQDGRDGAPGFPGFNSPAKMPGGQFLSWQPGKMPTAAPEGLAWPLRMGEDLLFQIHLNRTGKPETLQSSIGLYFTDQPPTNVCFKFKLTSMAIDIPAGQSNYVVRDSFTLPIDADVLAILPHAHYLARDLQGSITFPDGTRKPLLWIKQWDFRWQGDYTYREPIHVPKGSQFNLQFTYDNSTNNLRNPFNPPRRILFGEQSNDEMAELWIQLIPVKQMEIPILEKAVLSHLRPLLRQGYESRLQARPDDLEALNNLGMILYTENRPADGWKLLERALAADPNWAETHLNRGVVFRFSGRLPEAVVELETAVRLDPRLARAHSQLGFAHAALGEGPAALRSFEKAVELNPNDTDAKESLDKVRQSVGRR